MEDIGSKQCRSVVEQPSFALAYEEANAEPVGQGGQHCRMGQLDSSDPNPIAGNKDSERQDRLTKTIHHFDDLSENYDHYALKRLEYLENIDSLIIREISKRSPCTYLDVGCGTGRLLGKLHTALPKSRGLGIDISPRMVEICQAKGLTVSQADFFSYRPATPVDIVFLEFNVFGYLIVQNGLAETFERLRSLVADRGCIIFDILNPLCVTYTRLRHSVPLAVKRCTHLLNNGGVGHFTYSVNGNPITMGMTRSDNIARHFEQASYTVERHLVKYADHQWFKPLPKILTSQFLFVISR